MTPPAAAFLEALYARHHHAGRLVPDPLELAHGWTTRADTELAAFLAASVSFGRVAHILASGRRLIGALGPSPAAFVRDATPARLRRAVAGCAHRLYGEREFGALLDLIGQTMRRDGGLGEAFEAAVAEADAAAMAAEGAPAPDLRPALARWLDRILLGGDVAAWARGRGAAATNATPPHVRTLLRHLVPDAAAQSACKRHTMLLRWMVRPADGLDLGLWTWAGPHRLLMPVDTHVLRLGGHLGLTTRRQATLATSREITAALRAIDPRDPTRFDFALSRLGILSECPARERLELCAPCELRPACRRHAEMLADARPRRRTRSG